MSEVENHPTPDREVNALLEDLLESVRSILGDRFLGMYLVGSLVCGDFDRASDVDVLVVTEGEIPADLFEVLGQMHDRINAGESTWAVELELSYLPKAVLQRYDPSRALHPHIDRGAGSRLHLMIHESDWVVHFHVLRERGVVLAGPAPSTLVDPVTPDDLRAAMHALLGSWIVPLLADPPALKARGYQSYLVLTMCRILYTLEHGTITSKLGAARWAQDALGEQWGSLIDGAIVGRYDPDSASDPVDVARTFELLRFTFDRSRKLAAFDDSER